MDHSSSYSPAKWEKKHTLYRRKAPPTPGFYRAVSTQPFSAVDEGTSEGPHLKAVGVSIRESYLSTNQLSPFSLPAYI